MPNNELSKELLSMNKKTYNRNTLIKIQDKSG
ncbi:hypothetical protein WX45_01280 [Clostridium ljungdahlii DSM 13528]|uniref:Uncharacterized protein n=1 Tax=Clostridium ljungdahlii (strain ATCC 55383 / DSM 13528 / PETC) TaxID=748727 RepID=A0ABX2TYM6_CLOLD|nr:hypothetical protein WX45_01280 [Clostridium ljungdahlii DSM 13528]